MKVKKILTMLMLASVLMLPAMILTGCGMLEESDVVGTYLADSDTDLESKGVYIFYVFKEDKSFYIESWLQGSSLVGRNGNWTIEDGKLTVTAEDAGSGSITIDGQDVEYTSNEIKDMLVTINGDNLSFSGSMDGKTAKRISESEYKECVQKSIDLGPSQVKKGENISESGVYSFSLKSFGWKDEIYPSDTSGYYRYYSNESNKSYLVAVVDFKNEGTEFVNPCYATDAYAVIGGNNYSATIEMDCGDNFYSMYGLDPKENGTLIIYVSVPDEVKKLGDAKIVWSVPKSTSDLGCYYTSGMDVNKYKF